MAELAEARNRTTGGPELGRAARSLAAELIVPLCAVFTALLCGALIIWLTTGSLATVGEAYLGLWQGSFGTSSSFFNTLVRTTPFVITGLAVALSFKAGLFNIGAEGQLYAGALGAVVAGVFITGLPAIIHIPLALLLGAFTGLLYGAIPGALKAYTGAHEVITTIMLNFIAIRMTDWLIKSKEPLLLLDPAASTPRTAFIQPSAELPAITASGINLHIGILIALALVFVVRWLLFRTTVGFELRTVGTNPNAGRYAGMSVSRSIVLALALSGMLAGIAGAGEVLGVQKNLQPDFFAGLGFDSIAIALLARSNPLAVIPAALLWGGLLSGAGLMQLRSGLSIDLIKIIQALIIMFIAADQIVRWMYRLPNRRSGGSSFFGKGWGS
jgi:general nucleoside transport system permease protein